MNARALLDRAERLTGLGLGQLAAELGLKEATLYKAKLGHIPLSAAAEKGLRNLLALHGHPAPPPADATAAAMRAHGQDDPLAEQLAYLRAHATPDELDLLADVIGSLHRRISARKSGQARKRK